LDDVVHIPLKRGVSPERLLYVMEGLDVGWVKEVIDFQEPLSLADPLIAQRWLL